MDFLKIPGDSYGFPKDSHGLLWIPRNCNTSPPYGPMVPFLESLRIPRVPTYYSFFLESPGIPIVPFLESLRIPRVPIIPFLESTGIPMVPFLESLRNP